MTSPDTAATAAVGFDRHGSGSPPLWHDLAFWGMTATQFLGAFNDNLFKQLVLLLSVAVATSPAAGAPAEDQQWVAMLVFSLPFLLFSGLAGYLGDRYSKRRVIVLAKVAEIVVMLLGMAAFAAYAAVGLPGALVVLFLMGSHSAFFGPSKYGILPEMLRGRDLPAANGVIQMTTFVAIIVGTACAGFLKVEFADRLWVASSVCVVIAVVGTITALAVRPVPPARPGLGFRISGLGVPPDVRALLWAQPALRAALLASCMFWLVGGIVHPAVNALGKWQLKLDDRWTSLMVAALAVGISAGCLAGGLMSRGRVNRRVVTSGAWGIIVCLAWLALPGYERPHLLGFRASVPMLVALGFFAGMFVVPIQVYLQSRPPEGQKGRMIATMNIANWIAIMVSALLYGACEEILTYWRWPRSTLFAFTALLMLPVALLYRPVDERLD